MASQDSGSQAGHDKGKSGQGKAIRSRLRQRQTSVAGKAGQGGSAGRGRQGMRIMTVRTGRARARQGGGACTGIEVQGVAGQATR